MGKILKINKQGGGRFLVTKEYLSSYWVVIGDATKILKRGVKSKEVECFICIDLVGMGWLKCTSLVLIGLMVLEAFDSTYKL